jgi:hypothetical protein
MRKFRTTSIGYVLNAVKLSPKKIFWIVILNRELEKFVQNAKENIRVQAKRK